MILLLAFAMFVTGCVSARPSRMDHGGGAKVAATHDAGPPKADKLHGGGGEAILLLAYGIVILGAVVLDLILLPATGPYGEPFCCTQTVVVCCCR
jgi:hypothetical protein